jgi:uncharacterized OB-fold protein
MSTKKQIPIVEGLFTWQANKPVLIGGKCDTCGAIFFPSKFVCHKPGCSKEDIHPVYFKRGELTSYVIQHYPIGPAFKLPESELPYAVGLLAFPEGVQIPGMITDCKLEDLKMGLEMEVVMEKLYEENDTEYLTWKYRPVKN